MNAYLACSRSKVSQSIQGSEEEQAGNSNTLRNESSLCWQPRGVALYAGGSRRICPSLLLLRVELG